MILLVLVMLSLTAMPIPSTAVTEYKWVASRSIDVAAVIAGKSGEEQGVLSRLVVRVAYPGTGKVYVSTNPLTMLDTQAAARIAAMVASRLAGRNFWSYDYFYEMESDSLIIGGPSASAAMTALTLACLINASVRNDTVVTGMINPDGTVGPVGGLKGKLEAVATKDKVFVIPAGQRVYTYIVYKEERLPFGFIIYKTEKRTVDLVDLGRKLGVTVYEAASIRDVFYYLTGIRLGYNSFNDPGLFISVYDNVSAFLESEYDNLNQSYASLAEQVSKNVLNYASKLHEKAEDDYRKSLSKPEPYRMYLLVEADATLEKAVQVMNASLNHWDVTGMVSSIYELINETRTTISAMREGSLSPRQVELAVYITSLADDSLELFHSAVSALTEDNNRYTLPVSLFGTVDVRPLLQLVDSEWKALLARTLYNKLEGYYRNWSYENKVYSSNSLKRIALEELETARSMQGYAVSLADELGVKPDSLEKALAYFSNATKRLDEGEYFSSLSYSMLSIEYSTMAFIDMFGLKGEVYLTPLEEEMNSTLAFYAARNTVPFASYTLYKIARSLLKDNETSYSYMLMEKATLYIELYTLLTGLGPEYAKPVNTTTPHTSPVNTSNSTTQQEHTTTTTGNTSNIQTTSIEEGTGNLAPIAVFVAVIIVFASGYLVGRAGRR